MADPLIPLTAGQLAAELTTAPVQTATLLSSKELFERVRRALKNMGADTHDIESYISNLEDVLLGEDSSNRSLRATFNSLSAKAKEELSLAMNTTEPVVSDTAVGELVNAIQDPKQTERVSASIEHAASNAPASLEAMVARAEKRLPGLTAADRAVLMGEIKATEIPGTGKYKYTNKNLADFEDAYLQKASRGRLQEVANAARAGGASPPSYTDVLPEGASFERFSRAGVKQPRLPIPQEQALARVVPNPEALAVANNIEEAGIYHTLKEAAAAEKTAEAIHTPSVAGMLRDSLVARLPDPMGINGGGLMRRGARRLRRAAQRAADGIQMVHPEALGSLEAAAAIETGTRFSTLPPVPGLAEAMAARRILPEGIGALQSVAGIVPEAPSLLRRVASGVGGAMAAHPILSTAAFIGADLLAADVVGNYVSPAVESRKFDLALKQRDEQALNQLPIDVALRAAAAKNYVSPWEQAMEGRQTMQQMQQQAEARNVHRNAMGLAPGDSIL